MTAAHLNVDVISALAELRVLPIGTLTPSSAERVGLTLVSAGLPCLEITYRVNGATEAIRRARRVPGLLVGAGTILDPAQAVEAANAGAAFAVSPALNPAVVDRCRQLNLPFFPGVATPTEIEHARRLGLRTLKVFPVSSLGGVGFLRALSAVYPDLRFIPTGGIDLTNLRDYLALPSVLACGGSWILKEQHPENSGRDDLTRRVRQTLERMR